jgi:ATPase subunit of ABC transporter with duplicated ATPase domains
MISLANINKQYGRQLILVDASFQLNPGEKVGLVGPNSAGKPRSSASLWGRKRRTKAR